MYIFTFASLERRGEGNRVCTGLQQAFLKFNN